MNLRSISLWIGLGIFSISCYGKTIKTDIEVIPEFKHDLSKPLRDIPANLNNSEQVSPIAQSNNKTQTKTGDVSAPSAITKKPGVVPFNVIQGLGEGFPNYKVHSAVPDTSGAVGLSQYVQWVNTDIAVFDKKTGKVASGFPKPGNSIWRGFGGVCEKINVGSPMVKYDQLANRWVLSQRAYGDIFEGPFFQCVAISKTADATGAYYRYAFKFESLNDVPKLGMWPNAYNMTFNMNGPLVYGPRICALDRKKMLAGHKAKMQCRQFGPNDSQVPLLPVDLEGKKLPPENTPGYFVNLTKSSPPADLNYIQIYQFNVDFKQPTNSLLIGPVWILNLYFDTPPDAIQPGTNILLNTHGESFMHRVTYRQFDEYGSLLAVQTSKAKSSYIDYPAIRWHEIRIKDTSDPEVYQQATFTPDSKNRFLGSIAMDKARNIAIGYTVSSSAVHPSIELAYRNSTDGWNLQPLVTGLGSQVKVKDWGASSAMTIDPVDDCTFWYTNEYLMNNGSFNWSTAIINFKLPSCK